MSALSYPALLDTGRLKTADELRVRSSQLEAPHEKLKVNNALHGALLPPADTILGNRHLVWDGWPPHYV